MVADPGENVRRFVDRERELAFLKERFGRQAADLLVVYGRRRVGKSELVRQALRTAELDHAVVYQATEATPSIQAEEFHERVGAVFPSAEDLRPDWEVLLRFLGEQDAVLVIDEFPYLLAADESLASRVQRVWDQELQHTAMTLVLVGSSISVMEDDVLGGASPLHGRRTGTIDLGPLPFWTLSAFLPQAGAEERVLAWSLLGGTPHALQPLDPDRPLSENIQQVFLDELGLLHDEPELMLRSELARPNTYFALLRAMARGRTRRTEIAQSAGVESSQVGSYLDKLRRLRLVQREVPVTEDPSTSRRGRYRITDPLFRSWFRFIHGRQEDLAHLGEDAFDELVEPSLPDHAAPVFEQLCHEALPRLRPDSYRRVGRWWHGEHEIDVVGLTDGPTLVLGECKFSSAPVGAGLFYRLQEKEDHVRWSPPGGDAPEPAYVLFSRSGFQDDLGELATERGDLQLFDLEAVVDALETAR